MRLPHSSVGKESTCSAGDPGSIPRKGRSVGEDAGEDADGSQVGGAGGEGFAVTTG